jgi:hypothetical protein
MMGVALGWKKETQKEKGAIYAALPTERKVEYGGTWLGWGPSDYLCWFISPGTTTMI